MMIVFQSIRFIYLSDDFINIDLHRGYLKINKFKTYIIQKIEYFHTSLSYS